MLLTIESVHPWNIIQTACIRSKFLVQLELRISLGLKTDLTFIKNCPCLEDLKVSCSEQILTIEDCPQLKIFKLTCDQSELSLTILSCDSLKDVSLRVDQPRTISMTHLPNLETFVLDVVNKKSILELDRFGEKIYHFADSTPALKLFALRSGSK